MEVDSLGRLMRCWMILKIASGVEAGKWDARRDEGGCPDSAGNSEVETRRAELPWYYGTTDASRLKLPSANSLRLCQTLLSRNWFYFSVASCEGKKNMLK